MVKIGDKVYLKGFLENMTVSNNIQNYLGKEVTIKDIDIHKFLLRCEEINEWIPIKFFASDELFASDEYTPFELERKKEIKEAFDSNKLFKKLYISEDLTEFGYISPIITIALIMALSIIYGIVSYFLPSSCEETAFLILMTLIAISIAFGIIGAAASFIFDACFYDKLATEAYHQVQERTHFTFEEIIRFGFLSIKKYGWGCSFTKEIEKKYDFDQRVTIRNHVLE